MSISEKSPIETIKVLVKEGSIRFAGKRADQVDELWLTSAASNTLNDLGLKISDMHVAGHYGSGNETFAKTVSISSGSINGSMLGLLGSYDAVAEALQGIQHVPPKKAREVTQHQPSSSLSRNF